MAPLKSYLIALTMLLGLSFSSARISPAQIAGGPIAAEPAPDGPVAEGPFPPEPASPAPISTPNGGAGDVGAAGFGGWPCCSGGSWPGFGGGGGFCPAAPKNPYYCTPMNKCGGKPGSGGGFMIYLDDNFAAAAGDHQNKS